MNKSVNKTVIIWAPTILALANTLIFLGFYCLRPATHLGVVFLMGAPAVVYMLSFNIHLLHQEIIHLKEEVARLEELRGQTP